jgi:hypothetical protein
VSPRDEAEKRSRSFELSARGGETGVADHLDRVAEALPDGSWGRCGKSLPRSDEGIEQFSFDDLLRNRRECTIDTGTGTG